MKHSFSFKSVFSSSLRSFFFLGATGLAVAMFACSGSSLEASCDPQGQCEDWNTNTLQTCKNDAADKEKKADKQGCNDQLKELVSCESSRAKCVAGKYDKGGCKNESESFSKCIGESGGGTSSGTPGGGSSGNTGGSSTSGNTGGSSSSGNPFPGPGPGPFPGPGPGERDVE
jgi:uncharacterized membrane protein YgcG